MTKVFRFFAICAFTIAFATVSVASGQTYTQVDYPGAILTELTGGPNPEGTSVGIWVDSSFVFHGFTLTETGVFKSFDPPGSTFTEPGFIGPQGVIVGGYLDSAGVSHGFILKGGLYTSVDAPGGAGTGLSGISPAGEMSGSSCSDPACGNTGNPNSSHSFVLSGGKYRFFDPPGATSSAASTVNPSGAVVGAYTDTVGELNHGYLLKKGTYTTIDFPGAAFGTFAGGGNPENEIVGLYNYISCTADCNHAFLLSNGVFTSFDYPGATFSEATGIDPGGVIVGVFFDSSGNGHGFVRTP